MNKRLGKRIGSVFLSLAMILSLLPAFELSAKAALTGTGTEDDPYLVGTWEDLQSVVTVSGGYVKLTDDIVSSDALTVGSGKTVTLDLNGRVLKKTGSMESVLVISGGTLTLKDSAPNETHTGDYASLPKGGVITGGYTSDYGGGVRIASGSFTMEGGTITGNSATANGGGVYVSGGAFTMKGGAITGNGIGNSTGESSGGGVYVYGGTFTMTGGKIVSNTGGGVHVASSGTFSVSGNVTITDNAKYTGAASNVYLAQGARLAATGALNAAARIGVRISDSYGNGQITDYGGFGNAGSGYGKTSNFVSDDASKYVIVSGSNSNTTVFVKDMPATVSGTTDDGVKEFIAIIESGSMDPEHPTAITLGGDVDLSKVLNYNLNQMIARYVSIDLKGYTIDRALISNNRDNLGGSVFRIDSTGGLTLNDSVGGGKLTGGNNSQTSWSTSTSGHLGGGVCVNGGTFTMNGGSICDNHSSGGGGGVYVRSGTFTMNGGSITQNRGAYGSSSSGGVCVYGGTFTMNGGSITDNRIASPSGYGNAKGAGVYVGNTGGTFNVSGNVTITGNKGDCTNTGGQTYSAFEAYTGGTANNVFLAWHATNPNAVVTVAGSLNSAARIGVTIDTTNYSGAFTSGLSGKGTAANFTADDSTKHVELNASGEAILAEGSGSGSGSSGITTWSGLQEALAAGGEITLAPTSRRNRATAR